MRPTIGPLDQLLLGPECPLPLDRPFTPREANRAGVSTDVLRRLVRDGFVRRMLKGVYAVADLPDNITMRARALSLVVPNTAVVTDRTAAWLLGVDVLAPGDHLRVPPISVYQLPGNTRVRRAGCKGGERTLTAADVMIVEGVRVTTPLRTALDLGRLLRRDHAIGALDGLLRLGAFSRDELLAQIVRFRGFRGVVQLRELAPVADARAESPAESVLRLRWLDTSLPRPTPQVPVLDEWGNEVFYIDLALPELMYGAEYDGEEHHSSPEDREQDRVRRQWLDDHDWEIDVLKKPQVFGRDQNAGAILREGVARARRRMGAQEVTTGRGWQPRK